MSSIVWTGQGQSMQNGIGQMSGPNCHKTFAGILTQKIKTGSGAILKIIQMQKDRGAIVLSGDAHLLIQVFIYLLLLLPNSAST